MDNKLKDIYQFVPKGYFKDEVEFQKFASDPKNTKDLYLFIQEGVPGAFKSEADLSSYLSLKKKEPTQLGSGDGESVSPSKSNKPKVVDTTNESPIEPKSFSERFSEGLAKNRPINLSESTTVKPTTLGKVGEKPIVQPVSKEKIPAKAKVLESAPAQTEMFNQDSWKSVLDKVSGSAALTPQDYFNNRAELYAQINLDEDQQKEFALIKNIENADNEIARLTKLSKIHDNPDILLNLSKAQSAKAAQEVAYTKYKADKYNQIDNQIKEYQNIINSNTQQDVKDYYSLKIKELNSQKENFFLNQDQIVTAQYSKNKEDINKFHVPGVTPKEKLQNYYLLLQDKEEKLWKQLNPSDNPNINALRGSLYELPRVISELVPGVDTEVFNQWEDINKTIKAISPAVLINRNPIKDIDEGFFESFGKSLAKTLEPATERYISTPSELANKIKQSIAVAGIPENAISPEAGKILSDKIKGPESFSNEWWGNIVGTSVGMIPYFAAGTELVKGASMLGKLPVYTRYLKGTKYGKYLVAEPVMTGLGYKTAGYLMPSTSDVLDEATFLSGFLGGVAQVGIEKVLNTKYIATMFNKLFGDDAERMAIMVSKNGDRVGKGIGEYGQEAGETVGQMLDSYSKSSDFNKLKKDFNDNFGTMSKNLELFVASFTMGAIMGAGTGYGKISAEKSKDFYANLSAEDKKKADSFVNRVTQERYNALVAAKKADIQATGAKAEPVTQKDINDKNQAIDVLTSDESSPQERQAALSVLADVNLKIDSNKITQAAEAEIKAGNTSTEVKPEDAATEIKFEPAVNEDIYNEFVNTGNVPSETLDIIASKVKNREDLTNEEQAIFTGKTSEINDIIAKIAKTEAVEAKPLANGDQVQMEPQIKGGMPRIMEFKDGTWFQKVGNELSAVSKEVQQEAQNLYDSQNKQRVSGEVGVGQEPIQTKPIEGAGQEASSTSGNVQTSEEVDQKKAQAVELKTMELANRNVSKFLEDSGVEVNIMNTQEEFDAAQKNEGLAAERGTEGMFISKSGKIYINKSNLGKGWAKTILYHEATHPVINIIRNTNPEKYNSMVKGLNNLLENGNQQIKDDLNDALKWAKREYAGKPEGTIEDEFVVEVIARISSGRIKFGQIEPTLREKLVEFINKIAKAIGLPPITPKTDTETFKKTARQVADAMRRGKSISKVVGKENVQKFSFDEFNSSDSPSVVAKGQYSVAQKSIDKIDVYGKKGVTKLPIKSLEDIHAKFDGKSVVINSDPTKVGELVLPSGKTIFTYGGPGFLSLKDNVDSDVAFATTQIQKVNIFERYIKELFPNGKGVGLIATQAPTSMLSNSYTLRYVMDAISQLPKTVLKSSDFKTEFFGKDLVLLKDAFGEKNYAEFVSKYKSADLTNEKVIDDMISEMAYKIGNDNKPASFKARGSFAANLLGGLTEKSGRKGYEGQPGFISVNPSKFISKQLYDKFGLNAEALLYKLGEKSIVDAFMNEGKWGYAVAGFETDPSISVESVQNKGLVHPLFNAKFPGVNPFLLDGGYEINKMYTPIEITSQNGNPYTKTAAQMLAGSMYVKGAPIQSEDLKSFEQLKAEKAIEPIQKGKSKPQFSKGGRTLTEPKSDKWKPSLTEAQVDEATDGAYTENLKKKEAEGAAHATQITTTRDTYKKWAEWMKTNVPNIKNARILDIGAGFGHIHKQFDNILGVKTESYEPFYNTEKYQEHAGKSKPDYVKMDGSDIPQGKFDVVVNNAVLNVVPRDIRDNVVRAIGDAMKPGGIGVINAMSASYTKDQISKIEEGKSSNIKLGDSEVFTNQGGKFTYQKGFTTSELVAYVQDVLGDDFVVKSAPKEITSMTTVVIEKLKTTPQKSVGGREVMNVGGVQQKVKDLPEGLSIVDGFYSPIEKRIVEFKQPKASATKWKEIVGAKSDEAVFSGLTEWLDSKRPDEQVTKEEIQKFIQDNRIEIKEIVKPRGQDARYAGYILPGQNSDYKEVLVTLSNKTKDKLVSEIADIDKRLDDISNELSETRTYEKVGNTGTISDFKLKITNLKEFERLSQEKQQLEEQRKSNFQEVQRLKENEFYYKKHYDEPDILVHTRTDVRYDHNNKNNTFFIEEIQSDWGQLGKKEGFRTSETEAKLKKLKKEVVEARLAWENIENELDRQFKAKKKNFESRGELRLRDEEFDALAKKFLPAQGVEADAVRALEKLQFEIGITPSTAPYIQKTNAWVKLGLKTILKQAVEAGASSISWTNGKQQSERYDLRKHADRISYKLNDDGTYNVNASKDGVSVGYESNISAKEVENFFGKDIAQRIVNGEGGKSLAHGMQKDLTGDQISFGGTGMTAFYGDGEKPGIIGETAKALVKELTGVSPEFYDVKIAAKDNSDLLSNQSAIEITPELKAAVEKGMPQFSKGGRDVSSVFEEATDLFYKIKGTEGAAKRKALADERKALMNQNPSVKYIDDNIKSILDQLEKKEMATRKGNCP